MSEQDAPTTAIVRGIFASGAVAIREDTNEGLWCTEFDRWLAQHDAEVKAEALRDLANETRSMPADPEKAAAWLRARAAALTDSTGTDAR